MTVLFPARGIINVKSELGVVTFPYKMEGSYYIFTGNYEELPFVMVMPEDKWISILKDKRDKSEKLANNFVDRSMRLEMRIVDERTHVMLPSRYTHYLKLRMYDSLLVNAMIDHLELWKPKYFEKLRIHNIREMMRDVVYI